MCNAACCHRLGIPTDPQLLRARFLRQCSRCHYGCIAVGGCWAGGNVCGAQLVPVLHLLLGPHYGRTHGGADAHGFVPAVSAFELFVLRPQQHRRNDVEAGYRPVRYFGSGPPWSREPLYRNPESRWFLRVADVHQCSAYAGDAGGDGRHGNVCVCPELPQAHNLPPESCAYGGSECAFARFAGRHSRGEGVWQRAYRD